LVKSVLEFTDLDINNQNDSQKSALHSAVEEDAPLEIINLLLQKGADVHIRDIDGKTVIDFVKNEGVKKLLEEHAKKFPPVKKEITETGLKGAILRNDLEEFKALVNKGEDLKVKDNFSPMGKSLLHHACEVEGIHPEIISTLIGALKDDPYLTMVNPHPIVSLFSQSTLNIPAVQLLASESMLQYIFSQNNKTPLLFACGSAHRTPSLLQGLFGIFTITSASDLINQSALHYECKNTTVKLDCLKIVLGYSTRSLNQKTSDTQSTPLHFACANPNMTCEALKLILKAGAIPEGNDNSGKTPISLANENESLKAKILKEAASVEAFFSQHKK